MKWLVTVAFILSFVVMAMPWQAVADIAVSPGVAGHQGAGQQVRPDPVEPTEGFDFFDDFDSYSAGLQLVVQNPTDWELWSGGSGTGEDPFISDDQSNSSPNTVVIAYLNDAVKSFGTLSEGAWDLNWKMYIPAGGAGYFNTLADWNGASSNWGMQVFFNPGGDGTLDAGVASAASFTYTQGAWIDCQVIIDLDADNAKFILEGAEIYSWQWTLGSFGTGSPLQVEANDFYGFTTVDEMYVDDYSVGLVGANGDEFFDDFEAYTAGMQLVLQNNSDWDTWSSLPGSTEDPSVSDAYAYSGANSVVIVTPNDLIRLHGQRTSGSWGISFQVYIPAGKQGYFNTMSGFTPNPFYWGMEVHFEPAGVGRLVSDVPVTSFTWLEDTWQLVEVIVDLDQDLAQFVLDGAVIHQWQWTIGASGGTGPLQLDANDFYGATPNDEMYFDDYHFKADTLRHLIDPNFFMDDFEAYTAGTQLVLQNNTDWDTWSSLPGSGEDPFVSDAFAYSGSNSVVIASANDLVRLHGERTTGSWGISFRSYIPAGAAGYFNTMSGFTPNPLVWAMEVFFDAGGAGRLIPGGGAPIAFTWLEDTWQLCEVIVDLDLDLAQFVLDGTVISQWTWTVGGGPLQLDANDFYGATLTDQMYFDDYLFMADTLRPTTAVGDPVTEIPVEYGLNQNYPNPFNPSTRIAYALPEQATVTLRIYNLLGQEVITLADRVQEAGYHEVVWNARNNVGQTVGTGVYFYRFEARGASGEVYSDFKKMLFLK